jgi:DNA-binding response OmpR family regulator
MMAEKLFKILVVDDDQAICKVVKDSLQATGRYKVLIARGGGMGMWLSSCKWHKPDLILLDIRMGDINGLEVLEKIRATKETTYTPVIMLTGFADPDLRLKAEGLYCDAYVIKSEGMAVLRARIEEVLKRRGLL